MQIDYYEILGVQKNADHTVIKKAYRVLAMQFHPDKNPGNKEAEDKFKKAAEAYDVLGNAEKRKLYDQYGHAAFKGNSGGPQFQDMEDIFSSFGDIFGEFFGGGGGRRTKNRNGPRQGAHLRYLLEIELKDVVEGLERQIEFDANVACSTCHGSGAETGYSPETCETCNGMGQVIRAQGFFSVSTSCPTCGGAGKIIKKPCKKCKGTAREAKKRKIQVKIPPGVDTGTRLRVTGEGEGGFNGGPAGDLYVEVFVKPSEQFAREENDLIGEVKVSYVQAILGTTIMVDTFRGPEKVEVAAGTQPGDLVTLRGKGIPSLRGYGRGDMIFRVIVEIPKKLKAEEEKALKQIAESRGEEVSKGAITGFFSKIKDDLTRQ